MSFAATRGKLQDKEISVFEGRRLGPVLEAMHFAPIGLRFRKHWIVTSSALSGMVRALVNKSSFWSGPGASEETGFVRTEYWSERYDTRLTALLVRAKKAGHSVAGLSVQVAGQLAAAMQELESNIHEHAQSSGIGVIAYRAESGAFEFVVSDQGIGVLASLRSCSDYSNLSNSGDALRAALTQGVSRYGADSGRGMGFRPIFTGLMNLYGELRFRSGEHALTMDGIHPEIATSRISQKAPLNGFFASVRCHANPEDETAG